MRVNLASTAFRGSWVLILVLAIPFAAHTAGDGEIRNYIISINRLYENLEYELALNRIQLARQVPRGTDEEVTLSLYEGIILYEMGKQGPGTTSLKSALFLRPDAKLPVQVAPKVEQFFESVRKQVKNEVAALLTPREMGTPSSKTEQKRELVVAPPATGQDEGRQPSSPPRLEGSSTPPERRQVDAATKEQLTPFVEKRENKGLLQSTKKEEPLRSTPTIPVAPKQESRAELGQLNTSGCQAAVSTECERLLKRLLHHQETFLRADLSFKLGPIEELAVIAKQIRAAHTHETLQDASQALDSWQRRQDSVKPKPSAERIPSPAAPKSSAERIPSPAAPKSSAERIPSPAAPKQESRAELGQLNTSGCQAAVSTECERHMKRLLHLQETFLRADSSFRLGPIEELAAIAKQLRAASTHETLRNAAQALDSWQQRNLPALK